MADTLTAVAGAAIGFAIGGPAGAQWGWAIGSTVGSLAFAQDTNVSGPRLDDLSVIDSSYGQPIPIIYGRDRVAGNIIWAKDLEEVKTEEEEGKGGPKTTTTTYQYYATFALGLCEGEITGIRRIWINSKLVYKFTDDATVEEILASNSRIDGITVYTGSESQDPDPLIQADKGEANTPAFRGLAYMVFDRLEVTETGGIPNITVEVVASGSTGVQGQIGEFDMPEMDIQQTAIPPDYGSPVYSLKDGVFSVYNYSIMGQGNESIGVDLARYERVVKVDLNGNIIELPAAADNQSITDAEGNLKVNAIDVVRHTTYEKVGVYEDAWLWWVTGYTTQITDGANTLFWGDITSTSPITCAGQNLNSLLIDAGATGEYIKSTAGSLQYETGLNCAYIFTSPSSSASSFNITKYYKIEIDNGVWSVTETGTVTGASRQSMPGTGMIGANVGASILESEDYLWGVGNSGEPSQVMYYGEKTGTTWSIKSNYTGTFPNVTIDAPIGGGDFSVLAKDGIALMSNGATIKILSRLKPITTNGVALSTIVSELCRRAGLEASDIDVTDLTDTVQGYTVSRVMSARKAIEPLMMAYHFDGGEFNNKLNFIKRGGSVVTTIPEVDLGADSDDLYSHTRQQEAELPSEVILDYKDLDRDFQPGSQRSRRINTNVENISKVDVPIALTANEAKRITEIHHYNAWVEREKFNIQVTQEYIDLNPTDVIQFTAEGDTRKARIVDMNYGPVMRLECVAESGAYTSDAVAGESESVDQTLGLVGPTNLQLLDIPMLKNSHNDTGIYLAASGYYNGWAGCRVFKSTDDVSYSEVDALFNKATQGYTTNTLADASHTVWDRSSTLTVRWTAGTAPGSITESNAVKGVRYFLVGNEILIPVNETDNGNGTYTYDTFVRGRRGTDWATSEHAIGERVIILTESTLSRLEVILSTQRYFKGVSIGNYLANADSESFTNTGVSLKPFSPTFIRGTRDGSNNLTITWIPRSRYIGGALQPLPLFEESESYKVEILSGPGGSVVRTLPPNPTSKTDTYSASDQTTDGFTPGNPITVRISQYSATLGAYGYTKEATI